MELVQLVDHRAAPLPHLNRLTNPEFAAAARSKHPIELFVFHLLCMLAIEENTCTSHASERDLKCFIAALRLQIVHMGVMRTLTPVSHLTRMLGLERERLLFDPLSRLLL